MIPSPAAHGVVQICVKSVNGLMILVKANLDDSVEVIKEHVRKKTGINEALQRYVVAGKQLNEGIALREYSVQNGMILDMAMRLDGGVALKSERLGHADGKSYPR